MAVMTVNVTVVPIARADWASMVQLQEQTVAIDDRHFYGHICYSMVTIPRLKEAQMMLRC